MRPQPAPADLGKAGKALWRGVMREFDPGPSDLALLRQAAAVADHCEQLQAIVSRVDPTTRLSRTANEGFFDYDDKDMAELTARCVLGGAPQYLVSLYQLANEAPRGLNSTDDPPGRPSVELDLEESREMLACALIDDAAVLLARAVWHPWLSVLFGVVAPEGARPDHPRFPVSGLPERHDDMGAF